MVFAEHKRVFAISEYVDNFDAHTRGLCLQFSLVLVTVADSVVD